MTPTATHCAQLLSGNRYRSLYSTVHVYSTVYSTVHAGTWLQLRRIPSACRACGFLLRCAALRSIFVRSLRVYISRPPASRSASNPLSPVSLSYPPILFSRCTSSILEPTVRMRCSHLMITFCDVATLVSISRHSSALQSSGCSLFLISSVVSVRFVALLFALTSCSLLPSIPLYHWPRSIASRSATASSSCSDELQIYCHWTLAFRHLTDLFHFLFLILFHWYSQEANLKDHFSRNCSLSYIMCLDPLPVASISHNSGTVCSKCGHYRSLMRSHIIKTYSNMCNPD